jgi:hypothetical protein
MTKISLQTIREKLDFLLGDLIEQGLSEIHVTQGFYWFVSDKDRYELSRDPDIEVGDPVFDAELIARIDQPLAVELTYFHEILRLVAEEGIRRGL